MLKVGFRPGSPVAQQGIRQNDELAHDGNEGDLCGLSGRDQLVVLRLEVAVEAHRGEGRHVDRAVQECSAALDALMALPLPRLPRDRRQARKAGGLLPLQAPQFRHLDQHGEGRGLGDPRNADQDGEFLRQQRVARDRVGNGGVDLLDMAFDLSEPRRGLSLEKARCENLLARKGGSPDP